MSGDSFGLDGENVDQRDLPEVFDATASGGTLGGFGAGGGMLRALEVRPRGLHAADAPQTGLSSRLEKLLERKFNPPPKAPKMKSVLEGKLEQAEKKVQRGRPPKTAVHGE